LQILTEGVKIANNQVYTQAEQSGMATTLAAVLIIDTMAYIANVGDSRVYLLNRGQLRQITNDHSLVASLVAAGEITPEEAYTHPRRNIITRCLGTQPDIQVDLFTEELHSGDSLLLCSDGLWEMVRNNKIQEAAIEANDAQSACERLVKLANQNGGVDNVSVIMVKVSP
jgi:serine/threonine protein phosphatase PrpC